MFDEKELTNVFGTSDEGFRNNYSNVMAKLHTEGGTRRSGQKRLSIAVIALVACLVLTGTAFAINQKFFVDSADVGASWVLVSAPEDYYESVGTSIRWSIYFAGASVGEQPRVDAETAKILQTLLEGKVFTADGELTEIMIPVTDSDEFCLNIGDSALYNETGEEIQEIRYETVGYSKPQEISFQTKSEYEAQCEKERQGYAGVKLTDDYSEAAGLLGMDFNLPGVYTDECEEPEFSFQSLKDPDRKAVYVTYAGNPGIYYFAEAMRSEDEIPYEWYAAGAVIEACEIKGTIVYKVTSQRIIRYTWTNDSVVYMIFQNYSPVEFTDDQYVEIIASMLK